jgi:hypothetical protein
MTKQSQEMQPPPGLMAALRGGFNAITNHIGLILFPAALDLLLWMGPQVRLTQLIQSFVDQMAEFYALADMDTAELLNAGQEMWLLMAERFNLAIGLRTYPVGVFSLMSSRLPVETPLGEPITWEVQSLGGVLLAWLVITAMGLAAATLYFKVVSQAALSDQLNWQEALFQWRWSFVQIAILTVVFFGLVILVGIPGSILLSAMVLTGSPVMACVFLLFLGFIFSLLIPLVFLPHGIIDQAATCIGGGQIKCTHCSNDVAYNQHVLRGCSGSQRSDGSIVAHTSGELLVCPGRHLGTRLHQHRAFGSQFHTFSRCKSLGGERVSTDFTQYDRSDR